MSTVGLPFRLAQDAWRCLSFERGRARSLGQAWQQFRLGQASRWVRLRSMGLARFDELLRAETVCRSVGLLYPAEDTGQCAPWHLPRRFLNLPPEQLPPHPAIDADTLAGLSATAGQAVHAAQALAWVASQAHADWLRSTLPLLGAAPPPQPAARTAVCLHLFYPELWPQFQAQLACFTEPFDLLLTVPQFSAVRDWQHIAAQVPRARFLPVPNRGRDVAPWLACLRSGALDAYEAVCKVHGKRSPHRAGGDAWRDALLQALLGSRDNIGRILRRFRDDPALAVVGPAASWCRLAQADGWVHNRARVQALAQRLGLGPIAADDAFFAGTMFWFRPAAFSGLSHSHLGTDHFPPEMGQTEGTLAHAVERLCAVLPQRRGFHVLPWPEVAGDLLAL